MSLDDLAEFEFLIGLLLVAVAAVLYINSPMVRLMVAKMISNHQKEIDSIIDSNLTKLQKRMYLKLDETAQEHIKDAVLKDVILSAWDHNDEKAADYVKKIVKGKLDDIGG
tara:strand:- start:1635 stop:1967 length:333 start_codon:yes stop_codon:yes gene_type:complete